MNNGKHGHSDILFNKNRSMFLCFYSRLLQHQQQRQQQQLSIASVFTTVVVVIAVVVDAQSGIKHDF